MQAVRRSRLPTMLTATYSANRTTRGPPPSPMMRSTASGLFQYQTSAFVYLGAKFAEKAYKTLYPLAL